MPLRKQGPHLAAKGPSYWVSACFVISVCGWFLYENAGMRPMVDDAFISFRYARNLVEGHGLVFNLGERVEGFSNLTWTLLVAVGIALGFDAPVVAHVLALGSGLLALVSSYRLAQCALDRPSSRLAALAPLALCVSIPFTAWTMRGLETPLFVACATMSLMYSVRATYAAATLWLIAATLTRPDGVVLAVAVYGPFFLRAPWRNAETWAWPAVYGIALAALTAFRIAYYGNPLPNTFYAKAGGIPFVFGLLYPMAFLVNGAGGLVMPALRSAWLDRRLLPLAAYTILQTIYCILVGGDAFGYSRFLVPVLPCLIALAIVQLSQTSEALAPAKLHAAIGLAAVGAVAFCGPGTWLIVAIFLLVPLGLSLYRNKLIMVQILSTLAIAVLSFKIALSDSRWALPWMLDTPVAYNYRQRVFATVDYGLTKLHDNTKSLVAKLERHAPDTKCVAAMGIGEFGYLSRYRIVDMLGLTSPSVARFGKSRIASSDFLLPGHQRFNSEYVLDQEPDYILIPRKQLVPLPADREIRANSDFRERYEWEDAVGAFKRVSPR